MLSDLIHLLSKNEVYLGNALADKLGVGEKMALVQFTDDSIISINYNDLYK